jgi:hypothetical protein
MRPITNTVMEQVIVLLIFVVIYMVITRTTS